MPAWSMFGSERSRGARFRRNAWWRRTGGTTGGTTRGSGGTLLDSSEAAGGVGPRSIPLQESPVSGAAVDTPGPSTA